MIQCFWSAALVAVASSRSKCLEMFQFWLTLKWEESMLLSNLQIGEEGAWIAHENAELGMKIVAVRQLIPRGMQDLVMVIVEYGSNDNRLKIKERVERMAYHSDRKHLHQRLLHASTNFLCLSDVDSEIASTIILIILRGRSVRLKHCPFSQGPLVKLMFLL